jgi:hypothetical protein
MNNDDFSNASREEVMAALFANMVIQNTNMAFMFLGRIPNPETGKSAVDLEAAKFFIDQIEMLEVKTKGNLNKQEEGILKQSLTSVRMAFVEATNQAKNQSPMAKDAIPKEEKKAEEPVISSAPSAEIQSSDEESRKKFSKKY